MGTQTKNSHLALLGAAHSFNHSLFVIGPAVLTSIMATLNVAKSEIGLATMVASFIYGFGALAGGPLGDRIGEAKTIVISLGFSGLAAYIMLVAGFTSNIYVYAFALILMAVWASLYHPTANSFISKAFKGRVAEAMGIHGVGGTLGVVLTPTIAGIIGLVFGWPWAFVVFGTSCVALSLIFAKNSPKRESSNRSAGSILGALKIRELWVLLVFNVAIGLFMKGVELFFTTYLQENRGIDKWWAPLAFTLMLAVGVAGQWIGGKTADRVGSKKVLIATSTGVVASLLALLFVPFYIVGIAAFIILYGLSFYAHQPALNSLTGFCCPPSQRGAVYGIFFFTSFGIGSISQSLAGYIGDLYGLDTAFYLLTAFALAALILSFRLPEKRESR